jgi:hypothetical protein
VLLIPLPLSNPQSLPARLAKLFKLVELETGVINILVVLDEVTEFLLLLYDDAEDVDDEL